MNGVHDMGGQHGHGPVVAEPAEPVFHHPWEGRVYALMRLARRSGVFNLDEMRRAIERIPPAEYLADSYYERWLAALEALLADKRTASDAFRPTGQNPPRPAGRRPRFAPGDRVRTRNFNPHHHTRLPRYVRDRVGVVERVHDTFPLPDVNAHVTDPATDREYQHVYTVVFEACELWGEAARAGDTVSLDLWESYLAPAGKE